VIPATATALAATAASPELGLVEICRLVPDTGAFDQMAGELKA
jgi:hypothetical protein